jgi:hypothetical protein
LRSDLQRSNRKVEQIKKKVEEIPKIDRKILKTIETLSSTEEHDVYSGIIMDQLKNFGKLKTVKWNQNIINTVSLCTRKVLGIINSYAD